MSTLKSDAITAVTNDTDITITGAGSGVVKLGDGALKFPDSDGSAGQFIKTDGSAQLSFAAATKQCIAIACSDETTDLTTGTAKATFHMPYAFTLTGIKAGLTTAPTGSVATFDVNEAGSTILTTKLTIDIGEKTSATAATAAVIGGAGPALAADALMTVDVDGIGSSTAGAGLKVYLIGYIT